MHRAEREAEETGVAPEVIHAPARQAESSDSLNAITVVISLQSKIHRFMHFPDLDLDFLPPLLPSSRFAFSLLHCHLFLTFWLVRVAFGRFSEKPLNLNVCLILI